eukprot:scaffold110651_cov63-Phaeocystis_antarctica.AAC.1
MPLPAKSRAVGRPKTWEPTAQPHSVLRRPPPHHTPNAIGPRPCQLGGNISSSRACKDARVGL